MLKANLEQQKPKQQPGTHIKVHVLVSKIALTFDSWQIRSKGETYTVATDRGEASEWMGDLWYMVAL